MSDEINIRPEQTPDAAEERVNGPAAAEDTEGFDDINTPAAETVEAAETDRAQDNAEQAPASGRRRAAAQKKVKPAKTAKKKKGGKDADAGEPAAPAAPVLPGEQHFQTGTRKKNRLLILVSVALFLLTISIQYTVNNLLVTPKEGELVNWMFVTGSSNDEVSGAGTYYQAEANKRVSKPFTHLYFHGKYTLDGSEEIRSFRVIGLFSPTKILLNGTEVYNNGYGEKTVVGNSYNEILVPADEEKTTVEVFIYYPFAFRFNAYLTPMENATVFSLSAIGENFSFQLCLLAILTGLLMLISVFAMMFRSRDVLALVGLSMVVTLTGVSIMLQTISLKSAMYTSYLILSVSQLLAGLAMAFSILVVHTMMNRKRSYLVPAAFLIPVAAAAYFVPHMMVMRVGGLLMAAAAIVAGFFLLLELYDIPNLNIIYSSLMRIVSIYIVIIFAFNQAVFAGGIFSYSPGLSAVAMIIFSVMTYFIYARKVAQKRLEHFSDHRQRSEVSYIFSAVSEIISFPAGLTSSRDYAVNVCERTTKFLMKSDLLIVPDDLICVAAIKQEDGFHEIYNFRDRATDGYDFDDIDEHLSGPSGGLTIGSGFIEMKFGTPDTVELIIVFDNTYYNENSDFKDFMETLYKSTAIFFDRFSKNFETSENIEHIYMNLASLAESRCSGTEKHLITVYRMSKIIAEKMGYEEDAEMIGKAAILHDVGKITIPSEILDKKTPLSDAEARVLHEHVITGYNILLGVKGKFFDIARSVVLEHHENWDGSGYLGKKGEEISIYARIVKIADVFDALVSKRSYKSKWSYERALTYIMERSGTEFDPSVVRTFMSCGMELIEIKEEGFEEDRVAETAGVTA